MLTEFLSSHNINLINVLIKIIGYLMPIPLAFIALHVWHHYRQERFIMGIKWVLLEIMVPRDVNKTPAAMELIFSNAFYHKSMKGFWEVYVQGAPWFWFSCEMVSIDGKVHFFIRTPSRMRNLVETQIYAQYPQAKVFEVDDYVFHVPSITKHGKWNTWGADWKKEKHDMWPIKTYKDFGDDMKTGVKEEFKIDPLTPTIEYLGSLKPGEQVWIQIIVRQSIKTYHSHKTGKHIGIYDAAMEEIEKFLKPYTRLQKNDNDETFGADMRTPEPLKNLVSEAFRHINQIHFDCGIRVVTLANKDLVSFDEFMNLRRSVRLIFRQFAYPNRNQLERYNSTQFDSPWSDPTGLALDKIKRRHVDFYRLRVMFHPPIQYSFKYPKLLASFLPSGRPEIFVLSVEELATLFHFPGMVSETPSFKRVESKISKPPANLPS